MLALERETGVPLELERAFPGGEVGAARVRLRDGRPGALSWRPGATLDDAAAVRAVTDALRAAGYPAPATLLVAPAAGGVCTVHELLPGDPPPRVDLALARRAVALVAIQRGRLAGRDDVRRVRLHLRGDGPGFCLHGPLRARGGRVAALERWASGLAREVPDELPGDDAVHYDLHPGNLLVRGGAITGVVDWDGAGRGDAALDLAVLRFGAAVRSAGAAALADLDAALDELDPILACACWAHVTLRELDWAIRHHDDAAVVRRVDVALERIG